MSAINSRRLQRAIWLQVQPVAPGRFLVRGGRAEHMVEIDEEANKYGEDVAIPESLRNQVVERLKENPDTSWDRAVTAIANRDFEPPDGGEDEAA